MAEFHSPIPLPYIPANLTVPQFLLDDYAHPIGEMRKGPSDVWFIDDTTGRKFTFGELKNRSNHLAIGLASHKIKENDVVLFFSPNHIDYIVATWAFHRLGATIATANPMYATNELVDLLNLCRATMTTWAFHRLGATIATANPMYATNELVDLLNLCRATMIVTDERFLGTVGAAAKVVGILETSIFLIDIAEKNGADVSNGHHTISSLVSEGEASTLEVPNLQLSGPSGGKAKAAFIFFSSGTTGKSKAIVLSHYAVIANILQMTALQRDNGKPRGPKQWALVSKEVVTGLLPFFHVYGLIVYWTCFLGLIVDIFPKFSLSTFLASINKYHISHSILGPAARRSNLQGEEQSHTRAYITDTHSLPQDPSVQVRDYSHVKLIFTGGASLSVPLMDSAKEIFPNVSISQGYGMSELIIAAVQSPLQRINDGSCGPMLPGFVAKVLKSDGSYGGPGETGELVVTGPSIGMGYLGDEDATNSTFIDGFSESGELFIVDRLKELIKVRGFQVAPAEIEDHLMAHPFVGDACIVPFPDEYSGEIPVAFIVPSALAKKLLEGGKDEASIKKDIQKHVSDHKIKEKWLTGGVRFIDAVPKSPSGKILRRILRDGLSN
ncbi:phenylacetyl-CoA ligase [Mycena alexandri]|uniref:Phenylacetyl-CoA ligase n=1 Tax=Mycena alexandri TaxID=1745969 RepID=A0AAD6T365_9AGAR|nr:phenylacetyl-CoA ligase [Mycena alexandri]